MPDVTKRKGGRPKTQYGFKYTVCRAVYLNGAWSHNSSRSVLIDAETKDQADKLLKAQLKPEEIVTIGGNIWTISAEIDGYGAENIGKVKFKRVKVYVE